MTVLRARALGAIGVVILAALVQLGAWLRAIDFSADPERSELAEYEARFDALRGALPADATVGFLMASPPEVVLRDPVRATYLFRLQYTLAPVRVLNDPGQPTMVADLEALAHDQAVFESEDGEEVIVLPDDRGLELLRDFGSDVMLFRQAAP